MARIQASCWLMLMLCTVQLSALADDINYSGEVSLATDSNLNNAWRDKDVREDNMLTAVVTASVPYKLSASSGLLFSAGLHSEWHQNFSGTDFVAAKLAAAYRFRMGRRFSSPAYTLGVSVRERASSSVIRDSTTLDAKLEMFMRITELTSVIAGVAWSQEEAEGDVFDQSRGRFYANMDVLLAASSTVFLTYLYVTGDVASVGTADSLTLLRAASALEPDDAFGDGSVTGALAYRLDATTHILNLGYNRAFDHHSSLDVSLRWLNSAAGLGIDYQSLVLRVGYLFQFE